MKRGETGLKRPVFGDERRAAPPAKFCGAFLLPPY